MNRDRGVGSISTNDRENWGFEHLKFTRKKDLGQKP